MYICRLVFFVLQELLKKQSIFYFSKTMFNNTQIELKWLTETCPSPVNLSISWYLRSSRCYDEVFSLDAKEYFNNNQFQVVQKGGSGLYIFHQYGPIECHQPMTRDYSTSHYAVARTWEDSPYMFLISINPINPVTDTKWSIRLEVSMKGPHQYISASEWPLMIFYMVMCIIYVVLGVLWLALSACYWRDLLRIQFWIGGVIFLGMLEKAVYYAEFQSIRYDGLSVQGAVVFAEVLSAVKRTLARVLVIIASLGYGIVKPRLGALLHRVVGVGLLYLSFSIVEGVLRVNSEQGGSTRILCDIVLAVTDSGIVCYIFISLAQTMKLLRLRRNVVKLSLYRHFTNTLIFAVIASVIFIVWTTKTFKLSKCQSDWRELWIDDAFWRFLFSTILLVIMFLWRPSANNQRYAFSPLVDEVSDEEEAEQLMNEAFEGVKMRGIKSEANGNVKPNKVVRDFSCVKKKYPWS
uniref:Zgc:162698 n=1 Tax=Astyanax mexicanus TaxID=7994 RepID=A0A8B9JH23_ASTMX